ncbi:MAG: hypothetical protein ACXVUE_11595, partial [Solirubrobacteraceae bacterium]
MGSDVLGVVQKHRVACAVERLLDLNATLRREPWLRRTGGSAAADHHRRRARGEPSWDLRSHRALTLRPGAYCVTFATPPGRSWRDGSGSPHGIAPQF